LSAYVRAQAVQPADRMLAWAVFCFLFAAYLATFAGPPDNPDAEVEFQTTSALVRNQSFALGGTPEADAILGIAHHGRQGFNVRPGGPGREHEYFSWSGVAQPLLGFPFYVTGALLGRLFPELEARHRATTHINVARSEYFEHFFYGLRNPLLGALTGALLVLAARRAGARRLHAAACGLGYGLCTYAWPQARSSCSDVQATAALFLAFVLAQGVLDHVERGKKPSEAALAGFGLSVGIAFLTRSVLAPAVAFLVAWFVLRVWQEARATGQRLPRRELAIALAPALGCFLLFMWLNERRFGDPLDAGYGDVVTRDLFLRSPIEGFLGVTVSPGSGLLWFAPGIVLCVPWLVHSLRRRELALPLLIAGMLVTIGVPQVVFPSWHGAWSYGPRYLLPLVPFLWFPLGVALGLAWERVVPRVLALALLLLGFLVALGGVLVESNTNLDLTTQAALLEWPPDPGVAPMTDDERRFVRTKFDWRFAAPWAHWRIFRHRVAGLGEDFPVRQLYFLDRDETVTPTWLRTRGFRHLGWVDLADRLQGPTWPGFVVCGALLLAGLLCLQRSRDPETT
jgi:hypothetical protein